MDYKQTKLFKTNPIFEMPKNERKPFYDKLLWQFIGLRARSKRTQNEPNRTQFQGDEITVMLEVFY